MKVCVCGSRSITNYKIISHQLSLFKDSGSIQFTELVSGGCRGPDLLSECWAESVGVNIRRINADWKRYGLSAGPIRNKQMADYSDVVIAFYDGKSSGTKQMIEYCKSIGRELIVFQEGVQKCY